MFVTLFLSGCYCSRSTQKNPVPDRSENYSNTSSLAGTRITSEKKLVHAGAGEAQISVHRLSDLELFHLLREKKPLAEAAFAELYTRHSSRIYAYCRYVFGDDEQTKDIFQETFTRFYESAQTERDMSNVAAYLLIIARNACLNAKRRTRKTVTFDEYQLPHYDKPPERTEMLQLIQMAMELLPDEYREAFFLREFEDLSYNDIASILDISAGTVRVRVTRARQKVREILEPYLVELSQ